MSGADPIINCWQHVGTEIDFSVKSVIIGFFLQSLETENVLKLSHFRDEDLQRENGSLIFIDLLPDDCQFSPSGQRN